MLPPRPKRRSLRKPKTMTHGVPISFSFFQNFLCEQSQYNIGDFVSEITTEIQFTVRIAFDAVQLVLHVHQLRQLFNSRTATITGVANIPANTWILSEMQSRIHSQFVSSSSSNTSNKSLYTSNR